ncbi:ATP-binding protein [Thermodesulfatator atlanticus]|uniref:ATP-binding protein n=1 Tax=Thermodesulfatator atlanticus TaxID=501497 RepID=UPI0003B75495|nr:ATP-binding protein [Thermodesulfatator atlanticus]
MKIETYRGAPFVDREEEIEFFVDWFNRVPQRVLWVYGPKSSGKTTVIEYVVEKKLLREKEWWEKSKYWVKYINLRRKLISSYKTFLHSFIIPEDVYKESVETDKKFSLKFFSIERKVLKEIEAREHDLFEVLLEKIEREKEAGKIPIIIVDEIQKLRDIYINSERELLKEFLNFCVSLTKEKHLSHVVILTSNTVFIERIYNDAKLKLTSEFKKIDHLSKEKVEKWLSLEGLNRKEIELVWEYLGGAIPLVLKMLDWYRRGIYLEEYLKREAWLAYTEIVDYLTDFEEEKRRYFKKIAQEIVSKGYYPLEGITSEEKKFLQAWAEKEILFYDPMELRVTGNSRVYEKGMEILLERG